MEIDYLKCGDCKELLKEIDDNSIDLTVTSPPYDNLRSYNGYTFDYRPIIEELFRVTKEGGVVVWVVADATVNGSETGTSFRQALYAIECGFRLHDTMIYEKQNYIPLTHNRYEQCFEYMFVWSKGRPKTFNPIMIDCKTAGEYMTRPRRREFDSNQAMRGRDGVVEWVTKSQKIHPNKFIYPCGVGEHTGHPAVFPEQLATDQILSWSNEEDLILDPFMGSGTTIASAIKTDRHYIGFEISEEYFNNTKKRIDDLRLEYFSRKRLW